MYKTHRKIQILVLCAVFLEHTSSGTDVLSFNKPIASQHASYFDVFSDLSNTLNYIADETRLNSLRNITRDARYLFHLINDFVFEPEENTYNLHEAVKILQSLDLNNRGNDDKRTSYTQVKVIKELQNSSSSSTCINDTGRIITGLFNKEPWAVQFFDAAGKPGPSITQLRLRFAGNYDQCRAAVATPTPEDKNRKDGGRFKGKYGTVIIQPTALPIESRVGVCLPDTCSDSEITNLANQILRLQSKVAIRSAYFMDQTVRTEVNAATAVAITILVIVGFCIVVGTLYDLIFVQGPKWTKSGIPLEALNTNNINLSNSNGYHSINRPDDANVNTSTTSGEKAALIPHSSVTGADRNGNNPQSGSDNSVLAQIFLSFSVYSNGKKLLNTSQAPGSLTSIHGLRFFSMSWVVLCHSVAFSANYSVDYLHSFPEYLQRWTFVPISNGFVCVDTFFTLSGLLTSYLTIKEMMRRESWKINWPLFYFHRFWRLTPPYMFALVIILGLTQYFGQGPLWWKEQPYDKTNCEDYWWTNLLYVNNLVRYDKACFGHSWYLANDMQFFILSPLMMIPFYFHRAAGFLSCFVILLASWITTGQLSYDRKWPTTTTTLKPVEGRVGEDAWMQDYYVVPWTRIGPFIVGIVGGYILAKTKGRRFKMPCWCVLIGWVIAFTVGLSVVYGLYGDIKGDNPSSLGTAALYNTVSRSLWGACICWIIIASSAGYGGPVNTFLSWSPFVVLGRLTYMSYLIHLCVVFMYYGNMDAMFASNDTNMVANYLAILVFVNLSAFVCVLVLESPMLGLEKTLIKRGKRQ